MMPMVGVIAMGILRHLSPDAGLILWCPSNVPCHRMDYAYATYFPDRLHDSIRDFGPVLPESRTPISPRISSRDS